jgi:membrane-associated protease RseP (regulator of RpoE activity)
MKNLKFGVFYLGLGAVIVAMVSGLSAQTRIQVEPRRDRSVRILDGRGSELGAMVSDVDVKSATAGVKIDEVHADSPAEKAGLKAGDIVVDYDGERVRSARQFTRLVQETPEGRSVPIGIMRDGKKQTITATPEAGRMTWNFGPDVDRALREAERGMRNFRYEVPAPYFDFRFDDRDRANREPRRFEYRLPDDFRAPLPGYGIPGSTRGRLGVSVQSITPELAEFFGAKNGGALVSSVTRDSAAAKAGMKAGDVIVSINGRSVSDADDLINKLEDVNGEASIVVLRDKKEILLKATLSSRSGAL